MVKNFLFTLALVLACGVSLIAQKAFPTPKLVDLERQTVDLGEVVGQGKPTVVAVWATWCQPCHMELDHMAKYREKWEEEYGVTFLAISVDKQHMVKRIQPLVDRKGWEYDILVDSNGQLQTRLGFRSIPQMYIIDGDGNIVKEFSGYTTGREHEVDRFLAKLASK